MENLLSAFYYHIVITAYTAFCITMKIVENGKENSLRSSNANDDIASLPRVRVK